MELMIEQATVADLLAVVAEYERFWGERDLRRLHQLPLIHEFGQTCLVARRVARDAVADRAEIVGYVLGFVTPSATGYVHLIATREDARGLGVGRLLHEAFARAAQDQGARRIKAITSVGNTGSVAFHTGIGFAAEVVEDYDGPGQPKVVFTRELTVH